MVALIYKEVEEQKMGSTTTKRRSTQRLVRYAFILGGFWLIVDAGSTYGQQASAPVISAPVTPSPLRLIQSLCSQGSSKRRWSLYLKVNHCQTFAPSPSKPIRRSCHPTGGRIRRSGDRGAFRTRRKYSWHYVGCQSARHGRRRGAEPFRANGQCNPIPGLGQTGQCPHASVGLWQLVAAG